MINSRAKRPGKAWSGKLIPAYGVAYVKITLTQAQQWTNE